MSLQAVIFDLDGTLLDHDAAVHQALSRWLPTFDDDQDALDLVPGFRRQSLDFDALSQQWLQLEDAHLPAWRAGDISFAEQRRRRLQEFLPMLGIDAEDEELDELFEGYLRCYEQAWRAFPDALACVRRVSDAGLQTAVLTNGTQSQQSAKVHAVGLARWCGPVYASGGIGVAKPDHDAYLLVCERLGVPPDSAVMVGDNYQLDVRSAREAGLRAVHLHRSTVPHRVSDPWRIATLAELDPGRADLGTVA